MGEDGFAHAIDGDIPEEQLADAESARDNCPTSAIDLD